MIMNGLLAGEGNKMKIKEIKELMDRVEQHKKAIAKERDELRELYDELGDLLETFHCGIEGLDEGIREICNAVDKISETV